MNNAKTPSDDERAPKQTFDLLGGGVSRHIEIFGAQADHQVTHSAADDIGLEAGGLEGANHIECPLIHQSRVNAMRCDPHFFTLAKLKLFARRIFTQQLVDKFFNH